MFFCTALRFIFIFFLKYATFIQASSSNQTLKSVLSAYSVRLLSHEHCEEASSVSVQQYIRPTSQRKQYYGKLIRRPNPGNEIRFSCMWVNKPGLIFAQHHRLLNRKTSPLVVKSFGTFEHAMQKDVILEIYGLSLGSIYKKANKLCGINAPTSKNIQIPFYFDDEDDADTVFPQIELLPLHISGPSQNRMDMVMMGDGYTKKEYTRFLQDVSRMTASLINGTTFQSFLPLLNVWGLFVPSDESGIGVNGNPKRTAFGLYRDGTELRGIYSSKPHIARHICRNLGEGICDFPSIIANDDYYGGLGGEFVITTRSPTSGAMVLRHEMGHNFIQVGEEYDDGQIYTGVNSAKNLKDTKKWHHWTGGSSLQIKEEKISRAIADHVWRVLTPSRPTWKKEFVATGEYSRWFLRISLSGFANSNDIEILLDGKALPWKSEGSSDRTFYEWYSPYGLKKGFHTIQVNLLNRKLRNKIPSQVCDISLHEYGNESECHFSLPKDNKVIILGDKNTKIPDDEYIAAFPTWSYKGRKSYRPTNEFCLMRNMKSHHLCSVCNEGLWLNFLSRVQLIDFVNFKDDFVNLEVMRLGQFRSKPIPEEQLTIQWFNRTEELTEFRNRLNARGLHPGCTYVVRATLRTPAIRASSSLLSSTVSFKIPEDNEFLTAKYF